MVFHLLSKSGILAYANEPENAMTDEFRDDKLKLLQEICDRDIALHSVELAVQVCCDLTYQSRAEVLRFYPEIIGNKSKWQTLLPSELHIRGIESLERFLSLGQFSDLEKAITIQRKAIIFTPHNSADRPKMLSILGISYSCRYEWFGFRDVKDIDFAIRQHSKALASLPRDSTDRPVILGSFGKAYLLRFKQFAERKDFDFPIDQMLEAVTSTTANASPLKSVDRARLLPIIGNLFRHRFE